MSDHETRRVWVGCLASYNAGKLHGEWYDLEDYADCDDWREAIDAMIKAGPCPDGEEWHVCDFEGFAGLTVDRYQSLERIWAWHEVFDECERVPAVVVAHLLSENSEESAERIQERYRGTWNSAAEYAEYEARELGQLDNVPESLADHIDWESVARTTCAYMAELRVGASVHLIDPA